MRPLYAMGRLGRFQRAARVWLLPAGGLLSAWLRLSPISGLSGSRRQALCPPAMHRQGETWQDAHGARHVQQAGVRVDVHGEIEGGMAHRHLGRGLRHAVLAQVSAEGVAEGTADSRTGEMIATVEDASAREAPCRPS